MTTPQSPLSNPVFARLFSAQVTSLAGTGLATIALALLAYDLAGDAAGTVLGTALAIKMIAYVFIAPIAGAITSRLPRRNLLIALDLIRAGVIVCFVFIDQVWHIYVLIFILNACSAAFTPTFQAIIPDILPDDKEYTRAIAYSRLAYDLENLASPTAAAIALIYLSFDALFVFNGATFLISAMLLVSCTLPRPHDILESQNTWYNTTSGTLQFMKTPRLRTLLALSFSLACAGAMVIVNTVIYVQGHLGGTERHTAIAMATYGAGSMVAALLLPKLLEERPDRPFMLGGGLLLVVGLLIGSNQPGYTTLLIAWFILGLGASLIQTPAGRLLKRSSNDSNRTQIYAAQFALSHACWLVAYPVAGWTGNLIGIEVTFLILAALSFLGLLLAVVLWPNPDHESLQHTHKAVSHDHVHIHDDHHQHVHEGWEGEEPHHHSHQHEAKTHSHNFVIDLHHKLWPS